jgi:hypothetical protein
MTMNITHPNKASTAAPRQTRRRTIGILALLRKSSSEDV